MKDYIIFRYKTGGYSLFDYNNYNAYDIIPREDSFIVIDYTEDKISSWKLNSNDEVSNKDDWGEVPFKGNIIDEEDVEPDAVFTYNKYLTLNNILDVL